MIHENRTKIVGTLGPASDPPGVLEGLIRAGLDVARLNASHGSFEDHARRIKQVRTLARRLDHPVGLLLDLPGPKLRLGALPGGPVVLRQGDRFWLGSAEWPLQIPGFFAYIRKGHSLMLSDGQVRLEVTEVRGDRAQCRVISGGTVRSGSGLHAPDTAFKLSFPVAADRRWIAFAQQQRVDWLGVSYVRRAEDLKAVRRLIPRAQKPLLLAKIETRQALDRLDALLEEADGLMVARGDLGVETTIAEIAVAQKRIIAAANHQGIPVVTATQMLESMIEHPLPTRAEVADISNAILDGTDAVMLSAETAMGKNPVQAVRTMADICRATESAYPETVFLRQMAGQPPATVPQALGLAAARLASDLKARAILLLSGTRTTCTDVARFRPSIPILRLCRDNCAGQADLMTWSTYWVSVPPSRASWLPLAGQWLFHRNLARSGDLVIVLSPSGPGSRGHDELSLHTLGGRR